MTDQHDKLEPDEEARKVWDAMPKNAPSGQALPPASGGFPNWLWGLILITAAIVVLALLTQAL